MSSETYELFRYFLIRRKLKQKEKRASAMHHTYDDIIANRYIKTQK